MSDRVWVITGASSGLGLAMALCMLSKGDKVIATVRSLQKFPESLKSAGAKPIVLDFSDPDENITAAAQEALNIYGHVDVLINNAGYGLVGPVEELKVDDIRAQFQANLFGIIAFSQPIIAHLRERRTGHILNVSSIGGFATYPAFGAYNATKAALDAFSDSLSQELALFNVRVLIIMPGYFSTNFFHGNPHWAQDPIPDQAAPNLSKIYTDRSQGYDAVNQAPLAQVKAGQIGDPEKLAERVYEVVTGTGFAERLAVDHGGKREWLRVPLGPDCGAIMMKRLRVLEENAKVFEPIWRSTDVEPERLKFFPRG